MATTWQLLSRPIMGIIQTNGLNEASYKTSISSVFSHEEYKGLAGDASMRFANYDYGVAMGTDMNGNS